MGHTITMPQRKTLKQGTMLPNNVIVILSLQQYV